MTGLLCTAFPETPALLDIEPSAFLMTMMPTSDYAYMPVSADMDF